MDYEYLINATPFELFKRAESWEENARFAQEELEKTQDNLLRREETVIRIRHRLEETQDELLSREEEVIRMQARYDALSAENRKIMDELIWQQSELAESEDPAELKAEWQAEALESVSMQRPPGSMQREWLQEEADKLRRQAEEG